MPSKAFPIVTNDGAFVQVGDTTSGYSLGLAPYPLHVNGYFEKVNGEFPNRQFAFTKRPGLVLRSLTGTAITAGYKIQGFSAAPDRTHAVFFANNGAAAASGFISGTNNTGFTARAGWTATGPVVFTVLDTNTFNNNAWAATDFNKGALIDSSGVWTDIADVDFTGLTKVTNFVALDGYLFIGTANGRVYNSDLNVPASWTATSFITPSDIPGQIVWLAKIRNYLIVFKERSVEFFQDVGNPSPGSPLESMKQLNRAVGCILPSTIQEVSDGIIFAGTHADGGVKIYKIDRDSLQLSPISTRLAEQGLTLYNVKTAYSADAVALGTYQAQSQVCIMGGKEFYVCNCAPTFHNSFGGVSLAYDNELKLWTALSSSIGANNTPDTMGFAVSQAQSMFNSGFYTTSWFVDNTSGTGFFRYMLDGMLGTGAANYTDNTNTYTFAWTSDIHDFGTRARKFMDSFEVFYTGTTSNSGGVLRSMTLNYRDVDYNQNAGQVASRTLNWKDDGSVRSYVTRLGSFRRRVFSISDTSNFPLTLWGYEINYNMGETEQGSVGSQIAY